MEDARRLPPSARRFPPAAQFAESATLVTDDAAGPAVAQSDAPWDALLVCVAGYLLTSVGRVHQLFPILEVFRPTLVTGVLAIAIYMFDRDQRREARRVMVPTTKLLLAVLAWMMLSVPGALREGNSFEMLFDNFIKTVAMYFIAAASIRTRGDVERLMLVYLSAVTIYSTVVLARFDVGHGDKWRLGHLYYYDDNDFATLVVTAVPFCVYFLHATRRWLWRFLIGVCLIVLMIGFVRAGSRGGLLALGAVGAFMVLRYSAIPLRWRISATALVALVVVLMASDRYWDQVGITMSDQDYNMTEESGRIRIWERGFGYMLQYPMFGVGPNNFGVAEGTLSPFASRQQFGIGVRWNAPHNTFVQVGAELGIPGLVLFLLMIASAFAALRRVRRTGDDSHAQPTAALIASLLGFVVGAFFLSLAYADVMYMLMALAVGQHKVLTEQSR
jgi:putative inorganic carbon (HCO3(-)) transporter